MGACLIAPYLGLYRNLNSSICCEEIETKPRETKLTKYFLVQNFLQDNKLSALCQYACFTG